MTTRGALCQRLSGGGLRPNGRPRRRPPEGGRRRPDPRWRARRRRPRRRCTAPNRTRMAATASSRSGRSGRTNWGRLGSPEEASATSRSGGRSSGVVGALKQGDPRLVLSCYGIYASSWSCWCPRKDELIIGGLPATSGSGGPRQAPVKLELEEGIDGQNLGETTACSRGVQSRA